MMHFSMAPNSKQRANTQALSKQTQNGPVHTQGLAMSHFFAMAREITIVIVVHLMILLEIAQSNVVCGDTTLNCSHEQLPFLLQVCSGYNEIVCAMRHCGFIRPISLRLSLYITTNTLCNQKALSPF